VTSRTLLLTAASLVAFASNSIFCRLALAQHAIDAATFTSVRLASGAIVLGILAFRGLRPWPGSFASAAVLILYAVPFSFAYLALGAGVGALVLFGSVQLTMIGWGVARGERPPPAVWLGLLIAFAGLVALTTPGANAPDFRGVLAMAVAGMCWGAYSLRGRGSRARPVAVTAANFMACLPAVVLVQAAASKWTATHASPRGIALAVASGALASGIGYSFWYAALEELSATRAAIVQLTVPILAAIGGVALLGEHLSIRLVAAGIAILGGVGIAIRAR
jgi:drug/metabolite transporter (DMT)-like permease